MTLPFQLGKIQEQYQDISKSIDFFALIEDTKTCMLDKNIVRRNTCTIDVRMVDAKTAHLEIATS